MVKVNLWGRGERFASDSRLETTQLSDPIELRQGCILKQTKMSKCSCENPVTPAEIKAQSQLSR